jgi:hypothetical protein
MKAGTLIVDIAANVARLQEDMASAKGAVQSAMNDISRSASMAKGALASLGVLGGAGMFVGMIKETIEMEAGLLRLAQKSGSTVEALSSLSGVAKRSGTDMDDVAKGMQKLSVSMAEAGDGTSKAGKVFHALKISVTDVNTGALLPAQIVMQELGQKLMSMKDQTLAVAFAQATLGKSVALLMPFLYEYARTGQLNVKVTGEQALAAKAFEDNMVTLESSGRALKVMLANELLPRLVDITKAMNDARSAGEGFFAVIYQGAQTALTGTDLDKANAELATLTQSSVDLAKKLDQVKSESALGIAPMPGASAADIQKQLDETNARFRVVANYQNMLRKEQDARKPAQIKQDLAVTNPLGNDTKDAKERDDYTPLARGAQDRIAMLYAEQAATLPLTEAKKALVKLESDLVNGYSKLTPQQAQAVKAWLEEEDALERNKKALDDWNKLQLEVFNARKQFFEQQAKSIDTLAAENDRIREQNEEIGLTTTQLTALRAARLDEMIVKAERDRLAQSAGGADEQEIRNLASEIDLLKQRRDLTAAGGAKQTALDQANAASEAFKRTANTIDTALTNAVADGLMGGFKKGEDIAHNFVHTLEDAFKSAVLTPTIRAIVSPVSAAVAGLLPNSAGGSGGGVGNLFSLGSSAYQAYSGNSLMGGITNMLGMGGAAAIEGYGGAAATAAAIGELGSIGGAATAGASGAALAAGAGVEGGLLAAGAMAGPIGLGIAALAMLAMSSDDGGPKPSQLGIQRNDAGAYYVSQIDVPGGWDNLSTYNPLNAALNDPSQYDPSVLAGLTGYHQGSAGESAQDMLNMLLQILAPAAQAAQVTQQALQVQTGALQSAAGAQAALLQSVGGYQASQSVSDYLAPMDRLAGAKSIFEDTLAAARSGDATASGQVGAAASSLLSVGRDVYASGPAFAELRRMVNAELGDTLAQAQAQQNDLFAAMPVAIQNTGAATIAALQEQTAELGMKLDAMASAIRQMAA